ncbi:hypothetical protein DLH72_03050 [Candidatus Gracilibacteria bacterium]|nr:MAG: hypothetical protein DLH72_03050 [Candidatus Gracilibacteria bacterium]
MSKLHKIGNLIFSKSFAYKFIAYFLFVLFLIIFKNFIGIIILTFIFGYLFYSISKYFKTKIDYAFDKLFKNKPNHILKKIFSLDFIIVIVYFLFIGIIGLIISRMIPKLIFELTHLPKTFPFIAEYVNDILEKLREISKFNSELGNTIGEIINSNDFGIFKEVYERLRVFSIIFFKVMLSLFLSFIFLLDREKMGKYLGNIKKSNFSFLYIEYKIIFDKVIKSFGVIIKAQATIAFVNTILTTLGLILIGYLNGSGGHYPYLLTLSLIVFFAGFIPVLGTFISSVPILLVGYTAFGEVGIRFFIEVVALISIIHFIEAYFLNPKIVSKILSLPISMTFVILIFSEELFGMAGLLLGISLFYFVLGLLSDIDKSIEKRKKVEKI